jgi:hypothetical protein
MMPNEICRSKNQITAAAESSATSSKALEQGDIMLSKHWNKAWHASPVTAAIKVHQATHAVVRMEQVAPHPSDIGKNPRALNNLRGEGM